MRVRTGGGSDRIKCQLNYKDSSSLFLSSPLIRSLPLPVLHSPAARTSSATDNPTTSPTQIRRSAAAACPTSLTSSSAPLRQRLPDKRPYADGSTSFLPTASPSYLST